MQDVSEGGLWSFPAGQPHSLQGLGPQGKLTGNFAKTGHPTRFSRLINTRLFCSYTSLCFGYLARVFNAHANPICQ
jgi:hypothetical protein